MWALYTDGRYLPVFSFIICVLTAVFVIHFRRNLAQPEVDKFPGCCHEGFDTREEALGKFWEAWGKGKIYSETGIVVGIPGLEHV